MSGEKWAKLVFVLLVLVAGTAGVVYMGGVMFYLLGKANPIGKTDFGTWWLYWSYYKDNPRWRSAFCWRW